MARRKTGPVITKQMYVHFAAVTIGLTAMIGLFADGEAKETAKATLDDAEAGRKAEYQQRKQALLVRRDNADAGSFGYDGDTGGAGISGSSAYGGDYADYSTASISDAALRQLGLTRAEFEALPPDEQARLVAQLEAEGTPVTLAEESRRNEALLDRARERSGASSYGEGDS